MNNKIKILFMFIIVVLVIIVSLFMRKYYLVSTILEHLKDNEANITNYRLSYNPSHEIYAKDGQYVFVMSDSKIYVNYNSKAYFVNNLEKTYIENEHPEQIITNFLNPLDYLEDISIFKLISKMKISNEIIDNIKCYHIIFEDSEYWINKENYLQIQSSNGSVDNKLEDIQINYVTDEMMQLPDLSEYTQQ